MRPLAVIGNVNVDLILGLDAAWPEMGTEIFVDHDELRVGGSAGNCSLAWTAMGLEHQISATVGDDAFGRWLRNGFGGRAARWQVHPGATTISVGITHPGDERTFLTTRGHLPKMRLDQVMAALDIDALAGGIALVCGSFLTDDFTADYPDLFKWAAARDIRIALDTGWPVDGWTEANRAAARSWLAACDIALFNERETTSLAGIADVAEAARRLCDGMRPGGVFVAKRGALGALAATAGEGIAEAGAPEVRVIDTIGAGDVFNAGFLAAMADGAPVAAALAHGTAAASSAISTMPRRYDALPHRPMTEPAR